MAQVSVTWRQVRATDLQVKGTCKMRRVHLYLHSATPPGLQVKIPRVQVSVTSAQGALTFKQWKPALLFEVPSPACR